MRCVETIDLASIDQFSNTDYQRLMDGVMQRDSMRGGKKKAALLMDISKFEELIERLEKHKEDQTRRLDAKHADIAAKRTSVCRRLVCCLASAHRVTCNGVVCV